jgi:hypothetical protein
LRAISATDASVRSSRGRKAPPGLGFGETALAIARIMRMNPWTKQGIPVDGARVDVPIRLNLDAAEAAAPGKP